MSRSAMRYLVYGYLGTRTRNPSDVLKVDQVTHGLKFCIYDSEQFSSESHCPETPAVKEPRFSIDESAAGKLEFTLLSDATGSIYINRGGTGETESTFSTASPKLFRYMIPKQTELVLYRIIKKSGGVYETRELWAGRVDTIRKDFYNNWSIYAEGELTYFNDIVLSETKLVNITTPGQIMTSVITKYNERIDEIMSLHPTITIDIYDANDQPTGTTILIPQLPRKFNIGEAEQPKLPSVATNSNLDSTFTISDGSTVWSVLSTVLDDYGGHYEVYRKKDITDTRFIDWHNSGTYDADTDRYDWAGYHTNSNQTITFGVNLLDLSEEQDTSDMFTVLIPHGQAVVTTTTNADGTTTSTTGPALTIEHANGGNGTKYLFADILVNKYGWIEKVETWNLSDVNTLYSIAKAYYKDLRIGSKTITVKAYDLKNLIYNEEVEPDQNKLLALDALYLYDVVYIDSPVHADKGRSLIGSTNSMPITGITIPLDRFPTDTEYTISNKSKRRNVLSPGRAGEKQKQEVPQPVDPTGNDPTQGTPEETVPTIPPIGSLLGIDSDFIHYPPVYLDRKFAYITAPIGVANTADTVVTVSAIGMVTAYDSRRMTTYAYDLPSWDIANNRTMYPESTWTDYFQPESGGTSYQLTVRQTRIDTITAQYLSTHFGYEREQVTFAQGETASSLAKAPGAVFYTDKLIDGTASMRYRRNTETQSNWFEHVFDDETNPHVEAELTPFISSKTDYYRLLSEANVNTNQTWMAHGGQDLDAPDITWSEYSYTPSLSVNSILSSIRSASVLGDTVGNILSGIGMGIGADDLENGYLTLNMFYTAQGSGNQYTIKQKSIKYTPSEPLNDHKYYYGIGVANVGDSAIVYYTTYYMDELTTDYTAREKEVHSLYLAGLFIKLGFRIPTKEIDMSMFDDGENGYTEPQYWFKHHDSDVNMDYYTETTWAEIEDYQRDPSRYPDVTAYGETDLWYAVKGSLEPEYVPYTRVVGNNDLLSKISKRGYQNKILNKLANTWVLYNCWKNYWDGNYDAIQKMGILNRVKARVSAKPFLILTKTKSVSSGESRFGAFVFALPGTTSNPMAISKSQSGDYYTFTSGITTIDKNVEGTPLMMCYDTLNATRYLFDEQQVSGEMRLVLTNTTPIPKYIESYTNCSPVAHMVRCGGLHTADVAEGAFFRLSGDKNSSKATAMDCITPLELTAPGWRSERQVDTVDNHRRVWYYGSDMVKVSEVKSGSRMNFNDDMENMTEDDLKKHFIDTSTRQPLIMGGQNYVKVTPNLYLRVTSTSQGGDS